MQLGSPFGLQCWMLALWSFFLVTLLHLLALKCRFESPRGPQISTDCIASAIICTSLWPFFSWVLCLLFTLTGKCIKSRCTCTWYHRRWSTVDGTLWYCRVFCFLNRERSIGKCSNGCFQDCTSSNRPLPAYLPTSICRTHTVQSPVLLSKSGKGHFLRVLLLSDHCTVYRTCTAQRLALILIWRSLGSLIPSRAD